MQTRQTPRVQDDGVHAAYIYIYRESINGEGRWRRVVFRGPAALETG